LLSQKEAEVRLQNNIAWGASIVADPEEAERQIAAAEEAAEKAVQARLAAERAELAEHEARVAQFRQEEDVAVVGQASDFVATQSPLVRVIPYPGFVIKTRRVNGDDGKIFINVFHHTTIKDPHMMLTYVPYTSPALVMNPLSAESKADSGQSGINSGGVPPESSAAAPAVTSVTPLIYVGVDKSSTQDKEGYVSLLYNVLVSSAYFERGTVAEADMHIAHPTSVNKVRMCAVVALLLATLRATGVRWCELLLVGQFHCRLTWR
jgi:hypothetical protein